MKKIYFTVTGTMHRMGHNFAERGMKVQLVKEPDNEFDSEAIAVKLEGLGRIGYVANSVYTRLGESSSAGRIYDRFGDSTTGTVMYVMEKGLVCVLDEFA